MSRWRFLAGFGLVALAVAGGLSYLADPDPDGLESVSQQGCVEVNTAEGERLDGECIARDAREPANRDWPLAGYAVGGDGRLTGVARIIGVLATLAVAAALFRLLRRPAARQGAAGGAGNGGAGNGSGAGNGRDGDG